MLVSIIIPTLNERDALGFLFGELKKELARIPQYEFEIIVVDDGSIDETREFVSNFKNLPWPLQLIKRADRGLATAVLVGMEKAKGEIFLVMDADLSHPSALIPKMLDEIKTSQLVIGSRHVPRGAVEDWPILRKTFSKFATLLARPISREVKDPLSGFFCIKKDALALTDLNPIGYKILLEILTKTNLKSIKEIPYTFRNRSVGKSKLNWRVTLEYFRHLLRLYRYKLKI